MRLPNLVNVDGIHPVEGFVGFSEFSILLFLLDPILLDSHLPFDLILCMKLRGLVDTGSADCSSALGFEFHVLKMLPIGLRRSSLLDLVLVLS